MPFFWYLLQHLFFGFIQFDEQTEEHTVSFCIETIGVTFLYSV